VQAAGYHALERVLPQAGGHYAQQGIAHGDRRGLRTDTDLWRAADDGVAAQTGFIPIYLMANAIEH